MSSLALLNSDGIVVRKLQFVTLPSDYVIPAGMTLSCRMEISVSCRYPEADRHLEPVEAYFYLGNVQAQVCRRAFKPYERSDRFSPMRYDYRVLTITVQGTSAKDVIELRDRILHLINSGASWNASNDLNPKLKIGFLRRLKKVVRMAK